MKRLSLFLLLISAGGLFGSSHSKKTSSAGNAYQENLPYFYVVLAEVSYQPSKESAQKVMDRLMKNHGATVLDHKDWNSKAYGTTRLIVVKDKDNKLHVAIDGTNSGRNWVANAALPIRGAFAEYDVPPRMRDFFHDRIKKWEKKFKGRVATLVGHSQGGMYVSQTAAACKKHYKNTSVITFNCYKPKAKSNQLHFKTGNQHCTTLVSPSGRFIDIKRSGPHWRLFSNHKLKYFLAGLKGKNWKYLDL